MAKHKYSKRTERRLLKFLADRYDAKHDPQPPGAVVEHPFFTHDHQIFLAKFPEFRVQRLSAVAIDMERYVDELVRQGWATRNALHPPMFFLTVAGYEKAKEGSAARAIGWLNHNPGISIAVSVVSLIISIVALFSKG